MIGELFAIGSVLTFVTSNALFHRIDKEVSASQINAFRTIVGSLTYLVIALILWQIPQVKYIPALTWLWLILSFIFGQVFGDTAYFKAQEFLGTTIALAISMTFPIFTTILSLIILKETLPYYFYISLFLTTTGVIIIAIGQARKENELVKSSNIENDISKEKLENKENSEPSTKGRDLIILEKNSKKSKINKRILIGIIIGLAAAISWSFGIILTEKAFNEVTLALGNDQYSSLIGNMIRFPVAAGILTTMSFVDHKKRLKTWDKKIWLIMMLGAIIGTSIGAYLYTEAILRANAAVVSIIGSSSPLLAIPVSWLINREKSNWLSVIGVFVTTLGIINIFLWQIICSGSIPICN